MATAMKLKEKVGMVILMMLVMGMASIVRQQQCAVLRSILRMQ
jgi:hypothetical protein